MLMEPDNYKLRSIRSFVRRNSRMTSGQQKAYENNWNRLGIQPTGQPLVLDHIFHRAAPRVLDIGSGMGDATIELAMKYPHFDFVSIEVHQPGVGNILKLANQHGINNLRVISEDIVTLFHQQMFKRDFDKVLIYFPDPWPKKRHHKRRLINHNFISSLLPAMKPHARLYIATDWEDYAEHIIETVDAHAGLINLAGVRRFSPRPHWRPKTKFERRGENLGHTVRDFVYGLKIPS